MGFTGLYKAFGFECYGHYKTDRVSPSGGILPFALHPPILRFSGQSLRTSVHDRYARTQENGKIPLYRGVLSWGECGILGLVQQIGSYMWRKIIMNTVRMILCGNVEDSRMNPSEKVGVVSVVFVSTEEEKIRNKLKKLQDKNPEKFYMEYVTPLDVDLTSLEHYPSIEISKNDLQ